MKKLYKIKLTATSNVRDENVSKEGYLQHSPKELATYTIGSARRKAKAFNGTVEFSHEEAENAEAIRNAIMLLEDEGYRVTKVIDIAV